MPKPRQIAEQLAVDFRAELIAGGKPDIIKMLTKAIEEFIERPEVPLFCDVHKRYKGARKPKNDCVDCWRLYLWKNNK